MIYLSLGSNIGNRFFYLRRAIEHLQTHFYDMRYSLVVQTEALLPPNAPADWNCPYLNMVIEAKTHLSPEEALAKIQQIEIHMGRPPHHERWSPRIIDIDLLLWDEQNIDLPHLRLPHPEWLNRAFLVHLMAMLVGDGSALGRLCMEHAHKHFDPSVAFDAFPIHSPWVGVVNLTPDSFSDGGKNLRPEKALETIRQQFEAGIPIVEIGAQSTRPNAPLMDAHTERERFGALWECLDDWWNSGYRFEISLDSFHDVIILENLHRPWLKWINDVRGSLQNHTLQKILEHEKCLVKMHHTGIPFEPHDHLSFDSPILQRLLEWGEKSLGSLEQIGFKRSHIILDPGIGFGKSMHQNMIILQSIANLKSLGCPLMVGHSRKSYLKAFKNLPPWERDIETMGVSMYLYQQGIDFLRVHNVIEHQRLLSVWETFLGHAPPKAPRLG